MNIAKIISQIRREHQITQAELAKRSGLDFTTVSKLEKGSLIGTIKTHMKLAKAFDLSLRDFYNRLDIGQTIKKDYFKATREPGNKFYYNKNAYADILLPHISNIKMLPEKVILKKNGCTHLEQKPLGTDQFIYVLAGSLELVIGKKIIVVHKGENVYFNASKQHLIRNTTSKQTVFLRITTPNSY